MSVEPGDKPQVNEDQNQERGFGDEDLVPPASERDDDESEESIIFILGDPQHEPPQNWWSRWRRPLGRYSVYFGLAVIAAGMLQHFVVAPFYAPTKPATAMLQPQAPTLFVVPRNESAGVPTLEPDGSVRARQYRTLETPMDFEPPVLVEGRATTGVKKITGETPLVWDLLCAALHLPVGKMEVTAVVDGGQVKAGPAIKKQTANLLLWTVAKDGTMRFAFPKLWHLGCLLLLAMVSLGLGYVSRLCWRDTVFWWTGQYDYEAGTVLERVAYPAGLAISAYLFRDYGNMMSIFIMLGIGSIAVRSSQRVAVTGALLFCAAGGALTTGIEQPVAALAADYGVLGIYVWDIVMLSALAVLLLVRMRPWGSPITVVTASGPMIQDVRIVDDRSARN